jgi:thiamine-monophosphate kinase
MATAAMDVSDGLLADLDKLCAASHCGASIDVDALPTSPDLLATFDAATCVDYALAGGDDYEIIFTIPPSERPRLASVGVRCSPIGEITSDGHVTCRRGSTPFNVKRRGYDHFDKDGTQ